MNTYTVWNIEGTGCDTYKELLILERDGYAHSSEITTDNIEGIVTMLMQEWNGDLGVQLLPLHITEYIS